MAEELDKALGEINDIYFKYKSPQITPVGLPEEVSKAPMPEVGGIKKVTSGGNLDDLLGELNKGLTSKPAEKPVGIPEKKGWTESPTAMGLGGHFVRGFQTLPNLAQKLADIGGKALGIEKAPGESILEKASRILEPKPEQRAGMEELGKTLPGMIAGGIAEAPGSIMPYMLGGGITHALSIPGLVGSILTMAGIGAVSRSDKGVEEVIKGLPEDVVIGGIFHYLGPAFKKILPGGKTTAGEILAEGGTEVTRAGQTKVVKASVMAAMFGGQALKETGDIKQAISSGFVGALLGVTSGKGIKKGIYPTKLLSVSEQKKESEKPFPEASTDERAKMGVEMMNNPGGVTEEQFRTAFPDPEKGGLSLNDAIMGWAITPEVARGDVPTGGPKTFSEAKVSRAGEQGRLALTNERGYLFDLEFNKDGSIKQAAEIRDLDGKVIAKNIKVMTGRLFDQVFLPLKWRNPFTEDTVNRKDIFKIPVERREIIEPGKVSIRGVGNETIKRIDILEPELKEKPEPGREPSGTLLPPTSALPGEGLKKARAILSNEAKRAGIPKIPEHTEEAHDLGSKLTRDQANKVWDEYKRRVDGEQPRDLQEYGNYSYRNQMLRETVEAHLGETKLSLTRDQIEARLKIGESKAREGRERGTEKLSPQLAARTMQIFEDIGGEGLTGKIRETIQKNPEMIETLKRDYNITDQEAARAFIGGQYSRDRTLGALAKVAMGKDVPISALHETIHFLEDVKLMELEKETLKKWIPDGEKRAEKLAKIIHNDLYGGVKSMLPESIRKIVVKLENFIKDFGNYLKRRGYGPTDSIDKIIRDIETGDIAKRRMRETPLPEAIPGPVPLEIDTARDHIIRARAIKDVEKEIKDDFRGATKTIGGALDGLKRLFVPGARGESAKRAAVVLGRNVSEMERNLDIYDNGMEKAEGAFDKMTVDQQYAFSQAASSGDKQSTPELNSLRKQFKEISDAKAKRINQLDPEEGLVKVRENYWPGADDAAYRAKQGVEQKNLPPTRIFEPTGFMKAKDFQEFNDMLAAGYEPSDPNPVRQFRRKMMEWDKFIYTHEAMQQLERTGDVIKIGTGEMVQPGFEAMPPPYGVTKTGRYVMTDQAAQVFKNWISRPLSSNKYFGEFYRAYLNTSTALQRFQLFGFFHGGFVFGESIVSRGALAMKQGYRVASGEEDMATFLKTAASVPLAPYKKYQIGKEIIKEWRAPGTSTNPRVLRAAEDVILAGGGFSQEKMFTNLWTESMKKDFREGKRIAGAIKSPLAAMEIIMKPLMQTYIPALKAGAFEELSTELRRVKPNLTDAQYGEEMRNIWNRVDDRLGQVRWQRVFMNNSTKNLVQMLIRAPGWTGGTIMEIGGAPVDAIRFVQEWHKTGKMPTTMPDRVAYVLSLAMTAMMTNAVLTTVLAGKKPEELTVEDYMAFQTGDLDEHGKPLRGMLPLYTKDVYAYKKAPVSTIWHKMNPIIGLVYELSQNKDYYGTGIIDPTKGQGEKIGEIGRFLAKAFLPFGYRGAEKMAEERGITPEGIAFPAIGVMPAPTYFSQTKATQKALEFGALKMPTGGRTQEEYERNLLLNTHIKKYMLAMSKGEPVEEALSGLSKDVQSGKLKQQDIMKFKTKIKGQHLEDSVSRLSIDQAMAVWRVANDEEKRKIVPLIFKKYRNLKDPRDKQEYASAMEKISNDLSKIYKLE